MRYGLEVPNFGEFADVRALAELAEAADQGGWDGFFLWDHIAPSFTPGEGLPTADVTVALTAIALATERIRFGALVTPLARRRPHKLSRELVSLDLISSGRLVLGVGLGSPPDTEFAGFGEDPGERHRAAVLDESLELITRLWRGETVDFDGGICMFTLLRSSRSHCSNLAFPSGSLPPGPGPQALCGAHDGGMGLSQLVPTCPAKRFSRQQTSRKSRSSSARRRVSRWLLRLPAERIPRPTSPPAPHGGLRCLGLAMRRWPWPRPVLVGPEDCDEFLFEILIPAKPGRPVNQP